MVSLLPMHCPRCLNTRTKKNGFYRQKLTRRYIQRYQCLSCKKKFGSSTHSITYKQKKPFINHRIFTDLCSCVSLRRIALNLSISYSTVYSRFLWLSTLAEKAQTQFLNSLSQPSELYLDEMESIEHTKLKPLTIPLIVDEEQRILGVGVGEIPSKGHLAGISRKKYGPRQDDSRTKMQEILAKLPDRLHPQIVHSDGKTSYVELIKARWPGCEHQQHPRRATKVKEEPHLKHHKLRYDPMFSINQRCAKLRSDVKRLVRRSWCTTKKPINLYKHLMIYACYNNQLQIV